MERCREEKLQHMFRSMPAHQVKHLISINPHSLNPSYHWWSTYSVIQWKNTTGLINEEIWNCLLWCKDKVYLCILLKCKNLQCDHASGNISEPCRRTRAAWAYRTVLSPCWHDIIYLTKALGAKLEPQLKFNAGFSNSTVGLLSSTH